MAATAPQQVRADRPVNAPGGFTLVETLVAMVLLTIGLTAVSGVFAYSSRTVTDSYLATATDIQALDMAERLWFDLPNPTSGTADWVAENLSSLPDWSGAVSAQDAAAGLYQITVSTARVSTEYLVRLPRAEPEGG